MFKKVLLITILLALVGYVAYATVDTTEINFSTVTSGTFDQSLRRWIDTLNQDIVQANGFNGVLSGGTVYYVDGNKLTAGNGLSWSGAFNTLSAALAASHANIAVSSRRAWATRNTIFVIGDLITEDLTKLAQKTDVIGLGSLNQYKKAGIMGHHVIEAASTAHYMGCRIFNIEFRDDDAGGILFDIPINQNGIEFINCTFHVNSTDTIGLRLGGCHDTKVTNCTFRPNSNVGFSTAAIQVLNGSGILTNVNIAGNQIHSGAIGIDWNETSNYNCWITNNVTLTTGMGIDSVDVTGLMVVGNRICTPSLNAADNTSNNFNILWAIDNIVTGANHTLYIPSPNDF